MSLSFCLCSLTRPAVKVGRCGTHPFLDVVCMYVLALICCTFICDFVLYLFDFNLGTNYSSIYINVNVCFCCKKVCNIKKNEDNEWDFTLLVHFVMIVAVRGSVNEAVSLCYL